MKALTYELEALKHRIEAKLRIEGLKLERAEMQARPNRAGRIDMTVFSLEACVADLESAVEHLREAGL